MSARGVAQLTKEILGYWVMPFRAWLILAREARPPVELDHWTFGTLSGGISTADAERSVEDWIALMRRHGANPEDVRQICPEPSWGPIMAALFPVRPKPSADDYYARKLRQLKQQALVAAEERAQARYEQLLQQTRARCTHQNLIAENSFADPPMRVCIDCGCTFEYPAPKTLAFPTLVPVVDLPD